MGATALEAGLAAQAGFWFALQLAFDAGQAGDGVAVGGGAGDDLVALQDGKAMAGASDLEGLLHQ